MVHTVSLAIFTISPVLALKMFIQPRKDAIDELERSLKKHKEVIHDAFMNEIQEGVTKANKSLDLIQAHQDEERNAKLLQPILPPKESLFSGKPE